MTERVLQMNSTQGATGPLEAQVKELRELVDRSLSGSTSMQVAALEAKIRLLEARVPSTLTGSLGGGILSVGTSLPIDSISSMML